MTTPTSPAWVLVLTAEKRIFVKLLTVTVTDEPNLPWRTKNNHQHQHLQNSLLLSYPYFQRLLHRLALLEDPVLLGHDVVEAGGEGLHVHPGTGHVAGADHRAVAVTGVRAEKKICSLFLERYLLMTLSAFSDIDCFI